MRALVYCGQPAYQDQIYKSLYIHVYMIPNWIIRPLVH